jgi:tubulin polyglutamylase TTLL6/13
VDKLKLNIKKLIIKTIISGQPYLRHKYRNAKPEDYKGAMCFEILGFDVLLDQKLKPWLLEINYTPSFRVDTPLDHNIKAGVITDALRLIDVSYKNKLKYLKE